MRDTGDGHAIEICVPTRVNNVIDRSIDDGASGCENHIGPLGIIGKTIRSVHTNAAFRHADVIRVEIADTHLLLRGQTFQKARLQADQQSLVRLRRKSEEEI